MSPFRRTLLSSASPKVIWHAIIVDAYLAAVRAAAAEKGRAA